MKVIEKYTGEKTYAFPNGEIASPETVYAKWPAAKKFAYVVETDESGEIMWGVGNLSAVCSKYNIDMTLSEEEKISKIQNLRNLVREEDTTPSAEERIAAALEYQNVMAMADATE